MILSDKQLRFLNYPSKIDVAEGASGTGKSQALKMKFVMRVNESPRTQHFISGESGPVIYRNIVDDENGLLKLFRNIREGTDKKKGNYLTFVDSYGRNKIIYVFGFGDQSKWEKVLGSTMGCGIIDEANLASWLFVVQVLRALSRPTDEFWLGLSLNPTEPSNEIYGKLINRARPTRDYIADIPPSIIDELKRCDMASGYTYWHFNHADNPVLTPEAVTSLKNMLLPGTPEYMSLIEGIRSSGTGTIFARYINDSFLYDTIKCDTFDIGIDVGSGDLTGAKSIMMLTGYIDRHVYNDDEYECVESQADRMLDEWVDRIDIWWHLHGTRIRGVYVDGAGVSVTLIRALDDRLRQRSILIPVAPAWKFGNDGGIKARLFVMYALINQQRIHFRRGNKLYDMLKRIVRGKDTPVEDKNDIWNDYYDAWCYSWTHRTEDIR